MKDWLGLTRDRSRTLTVALWPLSLLSYGYIVVQSTGAKRTDFFGVWHAVVQYLHGRPPYARVFPYPPSALLLMLPFGLTSFTAARLAFIVLTAGALLFASALCLRMFGFGWRSNAFAVVIFGLWISLPAVEVLRLANVDGLLLAGFAGALYAATRGRWTLFGALLGLTFALKPVLLPLILVPTLWRQWRAAGIAIAVPVVLSIPPLLTGTDVTDFFSVVTPTLLKGNAPLYQPFNVSLQKAMTQIGFPSAVAVLARAGVVILAAVLVRKRMRRGGDEALKLVEVSGLILIATFLGFSFAWAHYGLYLIPLMISIVHPESVMRSWLAWIAVYAFATRDAWSTERIPSGLSTFASYRFTWGVLALLITIALAMRPARARATATP